LRSRLIADPYFKQVPSMQPEKRKTALCFHAKDDIPEVRRDVFALLMRLEMRFYAVVRDKRRIAEEVREQNARGQGYRYHPNQLYDRCISRLFQARFHKDEVNVVYFAKRGRRDRTAALRAAMDDARKNFMVLWGVPSATRIDVLPTSSQESPGLQAADYFLWALQRLYERNEDRYWQYIWPSVALVHDVDDVRRDDSGEYYTQRNPLTAEARARKTPGI
jgi:hypothetical protein